MRPFTCRSLRRLAAGLALAAGGGVAAAQGLPAQPISLGDGRLVIGGDAAVGVAPDDRGFFNYSDYEFSTLRMFRLAATAELKAHRRLSVLGELRSDNITHTRVFALYARVRPWPSRRLDIQAGRVPPTFGAFTRRAYSRENPLIGYPLAYQYLISLRTDAIPATADELVPMRGRGWLSAFSIGNREPGRGLPLVSAFNWDTGVQLTTGWRGLDLTGSVTTGSASNPRVGDDNGGRHLAARATWTPVTGLVAGASVSRGQFLTRAVTAAADTEDRPLQRAWGADLEYARAHWLVRADAVVSEWQLPALGAPRLDHPLRAVATAIEGRYALRPGLYAAARVDHLGFSDILTSRATISWEAPVTRVEVGAGYALLRNVQLRASVQFNRRDGGRVTRSTLPAVQLLYWF